MVMQHVSFRKRPAWAAAAFGLWIVSATTLSAQISQVEYGSLIGTEFISLDAVAGGPGAGTNYDGVTVIDGVAFGERFSGQSLTVLGEFDQLGGLPADGLNLLSGAPGQNFAVFQSPAGKVISGIGPGGFPNNSAIGEGAVSLLFSSGQSEFGFRLTGGNGSNAYVNFFGGDGGLIQSFTLESLPLIATYGFSRVGGLQDIRGISIWNNDPTGIGLTGFRHDIVSGVPEPTTWAMMITGFGAVGFSMRRSRRKQLSLAAA
jgi:hypothetical protein